MSYTKLRGVLPDTELDIGSATPVNISSVGVLTIANTTTSSSTITGALRVAGGVGIAGAVFADSIFTESIDTGFQFASQAYGNLDDLQTNCITWSPQLGIIVSPGILGAYVSSDGITWTSHLYGFNKFFWEVEWSPDLGLFVAVGSDGLRTDGLIIYSYNGTSWTQAISGGSQFTGVSWSSSLGIFVAIGDDRVSTSSDGINWTAGSITGYYYVVKWSSELSLFVATGDDIISSTDGITWFTRYTNNTFFEWSGLGWSPELSLFVTVNEAGTRSVVSSDGINWIIHDIGDFNTGYRISWSPYLGIFVSAGPTIIYSYDGVMWYTAVENVGPATVYSIVWIQELEKFIVTRSTAQFALHLEASMHTRMDSSGLNITSTTDAISYSNGGTITTAGGVGITKKLFVGTDVSLATTSGVTTVGSSTPTTVSATGVLTVANTTASSSTITGALRVAGGVGIAGAVYAGSANFTTLTAPHGGLSGLLDDSHTQYSLLAGRSGGQNLIGGTANGNNLVLRSTSDATKGQVYIDETTVSSSTITGALRVAGGVGIAGAVFADSANFTTLTAPHGGLSGLLDDSHTQYSLLAGRSGGQNLIGGTASGNNLVLRSTSDVTKGQVYIDETTSSSSTITGALRVAGGVGIAGAVFADSANFTTLTAPHGGLSGLLDDSHTQYSLLAGRSGGQNLIGGTASGNNLVLRSTSDVTKGQVYIDETTASTSTITGALRVAGGVGIAGAVYVGTDVSLATTSGVTTVGSSTPVTVSATGVLTVANTTVSTSTITGALRVAGGVGISNTTDAVTATIGGSITTAGGAAIAKKLFVGTDVSLATTSGITTIGSSTQATISAAGVLTIANTTASTSNTTGGVLSSGGVGISNETDAVSATSGGSITTAGGMAVAKKLFVGGEFALSNSTLGVQLNAVDRPIITRAHNVFISGNYTGAGRWGLFMEPAALTIGIPAGVTASIRMSTYNNTSSINSTFFDLNGSTGLLSIGSSTQATISAAGILTVPNATSLGSSNTVTGTGGSLNTGGNITLYNATSNFIAYRGVGLGTPAFTTRSAGTKLILFPALSGIATDYSIGVAFDGIWHCVPTINENFFWYSGTTLRMRLDGDGSLDITGRLDVDSTLASTSNSTGGIVSLGGIGISNTTDAISATNGGTITTAGGAAIAKKLFVGTDLAVTGALSKGSGTFDIEHPLHSEKRLVHSFIEGPRCDNIYRGKVILVNGEAIVNLDRDCVTNEACAMTEGTFQALNTNPQFFLQNTKGFEPVIGSIIGNKLIIKTRDETDNLEISWMVIAERGDKLIKNWERTDSSGCLVTEYARV